MPGKNSSFEISRISDSFPKKIATIDYFGKGASLREITFVELERGVRAMHALFEFFGVGQGSYVAVVARNRSEVLEVFLAAFRVGAIPYAINPNLTEAAISNMFEELSPDFIFLEVEDIERMRLLLNDDVSPQFVIFGEHVSDAVIKASGVICQSYDVCRASAWNIPTVKNEDVPQFVMFTSGSTGIPKAILRDFSAPDFIPLDVAGIKVHEDEETFLSTPQVGATPLFHSIGDTLKLLQAGICVTMLRSFDAKLYLTLIEKYQPSFLWLLPSHLTLCNRLKDNWKGKFPRLKAIAVGGAPCNEMQLREARELFQCPVISFYGLTEGGPQFTFSGLDVSTLPANCVGRSGPGSQVKLIDLAGNETDYGELCFQNKSLFKEYLGNQELTQQKLRDGWFFTGDIFKRDEGNLFYYQGRIDDMFVCGGENIYPLAVEKLLLTHPSIEAACVVPVDDEVSGMVPVAMVVGVINKEPVSGKQLQDYCLEHKVGLGYPRRISVVDALPITGPGKIDRKKVKALLSDAYLEGLKDVDVNELNESNELDSALVATIKSLVAEICGLKLVVLGDNVFRIGMSSFHVTLFCSRVQEAYGIRISMEDVFRLETVDAIVARIQYELNAKKVLDANLDEQLDTGIIL
ncbi:MAG: AMP-binding protein [Pseudomonadota bacterium]